MYKRSTDLLRAKSLRTSTIRGASLSASLDKKILSFLDNDAQESFTKQCSEMKKTPTLQVISKLLKSKKNEAGILVPICSINNRPSLLFTVRARHLNSHAGEISFPGGKKDSNDQSVVEAALRETQEEISLSRDMVNVFATLGPFSSRRTDVTITAVIAFVGELNLESLKINQNEVSEIFTVPIADLVPEHNSRYTQFRNGWRMPVFLSKPYHIWGITANITDGVLSMIPPLKYKQKFLFKEMPDYLGSDQRKVARKDEKEENIEALDEGDIAVLKTYGAGSYQKSIKKVEEDITSISKKVDELTGIKESDTGLAAPALWDLAADKQTLHSDQPLQVARCTKIINADSDDPKYIINVKQFAKFVVDLGDQVAPTDIEEGMRVGVDRNKYQIHIPLPPKIDPTVTMMQVEEKPDVTYSDVGGCKEQIDKLREVVETPLLHPERFINLGIDPPKGILLFGPPGTGKTLCARAVANRTDACFIRVIGSELVQKYVGEGARMVRELFEMARSKKACIIFFDEIDAVGGARFDDGAGGDNEVQRTMLELINQLDGFDPRGNIKVLMATNRPDTLDPALMRPGRMDRKVEFGLPDLEGRTHIFRIHARSMSVERDIRYELLARLCPNSTGAEIRSVCTEAGMFAIRSRRKVATEKDFLDAIQKVIKAYAKFSATPKYMTYN